MTQRDRLYSKEQIEEWASKRADDAGHLSRQLLDTLRENERLLEVVKYYAEVHGGQTAIEALSNKEPDNADT